MCPVFFMKQGGSNVVLGEERLGVQYGNFSSEPFIGSCCNRFFRFSQDYETLQTHAFQKKLPTPLYEWKDAPIGGTIIYPPASRRVLGKTSFDYEISSHPSKHDSFTHFKHPGTIILTITTSDGTHHTD